ncbi:MAG: response regulator [Pseudomonadota bacterium]
MDDDLFDPSGLAALVIDQNHYQRGISVDLLRSMGFRRVYAASDASEGWDQLCANNPDVVLMEWLGEGEDLDFVRRIRNSEEAPNRAANVFMLTSRGSRGDVEAARLAGVNGYLRKPISQLALKTRVRAVVVHPRPFIVTATYVGPCRRRREDPDFAGPWRRLDDTQSQVGVEEGDVDLQVEMARACVAALDSCAREFVSGDARMARKVFRATQDLCEVAEQIGDTTLLFGAKEMVRYIQAQGATARLDADVVRTHIAALHQLVHLPHGLRAERESVAQGLRRMVDKKLRQAAAGG